METHRQPSSSPLIPVDHGTDPPTPAARDDLCQRITERVDGLHRKLHAASGNERKWCPGL